jgi:hypothetical protein
MNAHKKKQLGPRVKPESYESLQRLAAANNCTLSYYVESVLEEHVARQQHPDAGGGAMHDLMTEIDNRFAVHVRNLQSSTSREVAGLVTRFEKQFDTLNVMVDAIVLTLSAKDHESYKRNVTAMLQRLGPLFGTRNGKLQ